MRRGVRSWPRLRYVCGWQRADPPYKEMVVVSCDGFSPWLLRIVPPSGGVV